MRLGCIIVLKSVFSNLITKNPEGKVLVLKSVAGSSRNVKPTTSLVDTRTWLSEFQQEGGKVKKALLPHKPAGDNTGLVDTRTWASEFQKEGVWA